MAIRKFKPESPDKSLGKIKGDTEFARLGHLNRLISDIESSGFDDVNKLGFKEGSIGNKVSFSKTNYSDPFKSRDVIIPGVLEIARGNNGGLYNAAIDNSYNSPGPANTEWSSPFINPAYTNWAPLWDLGNRTFDNWRNATQTPEGQYAPPLQVGMPMVMREITTGRMWLMMFTQWTPLGNGGGFAYDRWELPSEVYFEKPSGETATVDKISAGVWLARGNNGGLYNAKAETDPEQGLSPVSTRWNSVFTDTRSGYSGFSDLSNLESRIYTDFISALDGAVGNNIPGTDLIMHDLTTDLYYKVVFDIWEQGGGPSAGSFAYYRTVIPQSVQIKFADGTTMTTASASSGGSGGGTVDGEGNVIIGDSSNNTVSVGPGGTHDIPNFSGMLIVNDHNDGGVETWLCGGGNSTVLMDRTPYGPGQGDVSINGGINGYTWTNTNNQVGPFTFTVIKTRNSA